MKNLVLIENNSWAQDPRDYAELSYLKLPPVLLFNTWWLYPWSRKRFPAVLAIHQLNHIWWAFTCPKRSASHYKDSFSFLIQFFFIEIKFIDHKIHHFKVPLVYVNIPSYSVSRIFSSPEKWSSTPLAAPPHSLLQPWQPVIYSVFKEFCPHLGNKTSDRMNH